MMQVTPKIAAKRLIQGIMLGLDMDAIDAAEEALSLVTEHFLEAQKRDDPKYTMWLSAVHDEINMLTAT